MVSQVHSVAPGVNWAGNIRYSASELLRPESVSQLQEIVAGSPRVRALGSRHSFSTVADSTGTLLDLTGLPTEIAIDSDRRLARVSGSLKYGELTPTVQQAGFALHNLGSLPHISVAGACATGTHGSGSGRGNLASAVRAIEFVAADGELVRLDSEADPQVFAGAVVALGGLGIVTSVSLQLEDSYQIRQDVYEDLPFDELDGHFDEIMASAYSVSLFLRYREPVVDRVWFKSRVEPGENLPAEPTRFGARRSTTEQHPVPGQLADSATPQLGAVGPWNQRLPHFRLEYVPSNGKELQTEYLLPRSNAVAALQALRPFADRIAPLLQIAEVRTIAADELWLSTAYRQDSVALHFTWEDEWPQVRELLPALEAVINPLGARPHWGKLFTTPEAEVRALYPKLPDFQQLISRFDPEHHFANDFLQAYIY